MKKHENEALERVKEQSQFALDKTVLEIEKKYQEQIKQLSKQYQTKLMEIWDRDDKKKQNNQKYNTSNKTTPIQQMLAQESLIHKIELS